MTANTETLFNRKSIVISFERSRLGIVTGDTEAGTRHFKELFVFRDMRLVTSLTLSFSIRGVETVFRKTLLELRVAVETERRSLFDEEILHPPGMRGVALEALAACNRRMSKIRTRYAPHILMASITELFTRGS
jgi:hypothetical protein